MAFDISTAKPQQVSTGFDISTAQADETPVTEEQESFLGAGVIEPALAIATGAVSEPLAGAAGLAQSLNPFAEPGAGARAVESTREALTFQPKTRQGQEGLQAIGDFVEGALTGSNELGRELGIPEVLLRPAADVAFEASGDNPLVGTVVASVPTAIAEFFGIKGIRNLRPGTKLLTPDGRPTKALENSLNKQGLVFDNLLPEAKAAIPETAPKRLLPGGKDIAGPAESILIEQIKSGAKDNSLAGLKVIGGKVAPDQAGLEAIRQGFDAGFVQAAKVASRETKAGMKKMLDIVQRVKSNTSLGINLRPGNIVGDSLSKRIKFIRENASSARKELDSIASKQLGGQKVDGAPVVAQLQKSLGDLDIEIIDGPSGIPQPVFKGSLISLDKGAQKIVKDVIKLMTEGGAPDALRMHKLKRQFDKIIDFKKKSAGGLSDAGRDVLKDMRASMNQAVRSVNPDYARVNDVLRKSLTALDDFQKAAGTSIDIFGEGSNAIIGQKMRTLMSNNQGRINLKNSVTQLNETADDLGGKFGDDIEDLASFANSIEDRFGAAAQTSLKGDIEGVINRVGQQGAKATLLQAGVERAAKGAEKLRGINDLNAFRAMSDVLNQK